MDTDRTTPATDQKLPAGVIRAIFDHGAIGMALVSLDGTYLHANGALCEQVGRTETELRSLTWMDVIAPEAAEHAKAWQESVSENPRWRGDFEYVQPDGTRVPAHAIITPVQIDGVPEISYLFAQSVDRRAFRTLDGAPTMTLAILDALDNLGQGVMIIDPATQTPLFINRALTEINGYTLSDLEALPGGLLSTLDPPQAAEIRDRLARRLAGEDVPSHYEVEMPRKDGRRIRIETAVQLIPGTPDLLVAIVRDVTERKQMQEHSERTERMNAMGRMASGTAHDFNNLLTSILGEVDLLLDSLDADPVEWGEVQKGIEDIRETAELGARFVRRLLDIGVSRGLSVQSVDVKEIIEKMEPVLVRVISEEARLELDLCDGECHARVYPDELEQVVLNLVLNASDATSGGGTIRIGAVRTPHDRVEVAVSDDGGGIPPEVQRRMFEPYFTTKGSGRGTGLGLSVVDAIVTRAEGTISVDTVPGKGTKITVSLPAADAGDSDST